MRPGKRNGTRVDAVATIVVVREQFSGHLRDAIQTAGALNGILRGVVGRCFGTEASDGRGREDGALLFACHFQHIPQTVHTDVPSQFRLVLCHHRKERSQIVDRIDVVLLHHSGNGRSIGHIANFAGTALAQHFVGFSTRDVAGHNIVVAVKRREVSW